MHAESLRCAACFIFLRCGGSPLSAHLFQRGSLVCLSLRLRSKRVSPTLSPAYQNLPQEVASFPKKLPIRLSPVLPSLIPPPYTSAPCALRVAPAEPHMLRGTRSRSCRRAFSSGALSSLELEQSFSAPHACKPDGSSSGRRRAERTCSLVRALLDPPQPF